MRGRPTQREFQERLEQIIQELRNEIFEGRFPVGSFLPSESVLAKRFSISNKSLRRGLDMLVQEGLIEKIPSVGNRVVTQRSRISLTLSCTASFMRDWNLMKLLERFHHQYPWIDIEITYGKVMDELIKSKPADLMLLNQLQLQEIVEAGLENGLEPFETAEGVYPFLDQAFRFNGQLYVRPVIFSPIVLCYNKDHFRDGGVPEPDGSWTWDDLIKAATQLSVSGERYGLCFHVLSENRWPVFLLQSGEAFEWEDGELKSLKNTRLLESLKLCKQIILNRDIFPLYLSENSNDILNLFVEGKVSMILTNYMSMNDLVNTSMNYDISPLPFIHEPRTLMVAQGIAISRSSEHKEAAALLADYMTSSEGQRFIRQTTTSIPACKSIAESQLEMPGLNIPSRYGMFREILFSLRKYSDLNLSVRVYRQLVIALKAYWSDLINDDQLCERLQEVLRKPHQSANAKEAPLHIIN